MWCAFLDPGRLAATLTMTLLCQAVLSFANMYDSASFQIVPQSSVVLLSRVNILVTMEPYWYGGPWDAGKPGTLMERNGTEPEVFVVQYRCGSRTRGQTIGMKY